MSKIKLRLKGKGKPWKKGQSCESNPSQNKFRQLAYNHQPINNFNCLSIHNINLGKSTDDLSVGGKTLGSNVSVWTNCTNITFSKILERNINSSILHKEILAVVASVTEIIQKEGGNESDAEYLAILIKFMGSTFQQSNKEPITLIATSYLVNLLLKKVDKKILIHHYTLLKDIFIKSYHGYVKNIQFNDNNNIPVIHAEYESCGLFHSTFLDSIATLLKSQPESILNNKSSSQQLFQILLENTLDNKPKIRKSALRALIKIFNLPLTQAHVANINDHHPFHTFITWLLEFGQETLNETLKEYVFDNNAMKTTLKNFEGKSDDKNHHNKYSNKNNDKQSKSVGNIEVTNKLRHLLIALKELTLLISRYPQLPCEKIAATLKKDMISSGNCIDKMDVGVEQKSCCCIIGVLVQKTFEYSYKAFNLPILNDQEKTLKLTALQVISKVFEINYHSKSVIMNFNMANKTAPHKNNHDKFTFTGTTSPVAATLPPLSHHFDILLNAKILSALYELFPNNLNSGDSFRDSFSIKSTFRLIGTQDGLNLLLLWCKSLMSGVLSLVSKDPNIAKSHFTRTLAICTRYLSFFTDDSNISKQKLDETIGDFLFQTLSKILQAALGDKLAIDDDSNNVMSIKNLLNTVSECLNPLLLLERKTNSSSFNEFETNCVRGDTTAIGLKLCEYFFQATAVYFFDKFGSKDTSSPTFNYYRPSTESSPLPNHFKHLVNKIARLKEIMNNNDEINNNKNNNNDDEGNLKQRNLNRCIKVLIESYGPNLILSRLLPINIDPDSIHLDLRRSWLIPALATHVTTTPPLASPTPKSNEIKVREDLNFAKPGGAGWPSLTVFTSYLLPLSHMLLERAREQELSNNRVLSQTMNALSEQIWTLLPTFTTVANRADIRRHLESSFFQNLFKEHVKLPLNTEERGHLILQSIRNLVGKNANFNVAAPANAGDDLSLLQDRFFKSIVPTLFNMYVTLSISSDTSSCHTSKLKIAETLKVCLAKCPDALVSLFTMKLKDKLSAAITLHSHVVGGEMESPTTSSTITTHTPRVVEQLDPDAIKIPSWLDIFIFILPYYSPYPHQLGPISNTPSSNSISQQQTLDDTKYSVFNFIIRFICCIIQKSIDDPFYGYVMNYQPTLAKQIQKKSYKILEEIVGLYDQYVNHVPISPQLDYERLKPLCSLFVTHYIDSLDKTAVNNVSTDKKKHRLTQSAQDNDDEGNYYFTGAVMGLLGRVGVAKTYPSSLACRFRILQNLLRILVDAAAKDASTLDQLLPMFYALLPEAVLATHGKGISVRAKQASFDFIQEFLRLYLSPWKASSSSRNGRPKKTVLDYQTAASMMPIEMVSIDTFIYMLLESLKSYFGSSCSINRIQPALNPPLLGGGSSSEKISIDDDDTSSMLMQDENESEEWEDIDELASTANSRSQLQSRSMPTYPAVPALFSIHNVQEATAILNTLQRFYLKSHTYDENYMHISEEAKDHILRLLVGYLLLKQRTFVKHIVDFIYQIQTGIVTPRYLILKYTPLILNQFARINRSIRASVAFKIKMILIKLYRKNDPAIFATYVPKCYLKLFERIRKLEDRKIKKRSTRESSNSATALDYPNAMSATTSKRKLKNDVRLKDDTNLDGSTDEIMDLLNSREENISINRGGFLSNVLPGTGNSTKTGEKDKPFPISDDGKIIIGASRSISRLKDMTEEVAGHGRQLLLLDDEEDDEDENLQNHNSKRKKIGQKPKDKSKKTNKSGASIKKVRFAATNASQKRNEKINVANNNTTMFIPLDRAVTAQLKDGTGTNKKGKFRNPSGSYKKKSSYNNVGGFSGIVGKGKTKKNK